MAVGLVSIQVSRAQAGCNVSGVVLSFDSSSMCLEVFAFVLGMAHGAMQMYRPREVIVSAR
eukprot:90209-Pyramimonas_sp.AAC.2